MMGDDYAGGFGWRRTMLEDDDAEGSAQKRRKPRKNVAHPKPPHIDQYVWSHILKKADREALSTHYFEEILAARESPLRLREPAS